MDTFEATLQDSDISVFDVQSNSLDCVSNFEKTRWFYVLRVKRPPQDSLNSLLRMSNRAVALFEQPPLYEPASSISKTPKSARSGENKSSPPNDYTDSFHISVGWSLTEPSAEEKASMENIDLSKVNELKIRFDCEDLQAFQAKHFPGSGSLQPVQRTREPDHDTITPGFDDEDDGLGYYPDGVKRTLTDEQIGIFRHSEIHALLREKQLREEELMEGSSSSAERTNPEESAVTEPEKASLDANIAVEDTQPVEDCEGGKSEPYVSVMKKRAVASSDMPLDYGEESASLQSACKQAPQFKRRRIISYED
ncbi:hypothetical protein AOCH_003142 [Aspergillus ochraceoroseus]|uniref:Uncharacterized protein n=1 Tax=Aspergillus ochraceoroseus TaxID=138278 RepID=A0A0F8VA66_9EURO|nr:hypothetical protein AOCH_003142 [Aspergillus ochraceoroseus]